MRWRLLSVLMILALVAVACGDDDATTTSSSGPAAASCEVADLDLVTPGQLTVATGEPAFPPWVGTPTGDNFDEPESGVGFESAVVYAVAEEMGFSADQVVWVRVGFDEAIGVGPKNFDFNIQQYTITAERDEVVDFSDPYYANAQALVAFADNPIANATSFADLADARFGVQVGTTSLDYIENVIQPNTTVSVYESTVDAKSALEADQIDGLVVDIATAYYITAVEIPGSVVVAAFGAADAPDEFGMLFEEGNPLRDCVNVALAALRADGTLTTLEELWLVDAGGAITISE
ncbi:MAG: ABC transporter substrate-binding protein [Acidimicrobiia bacterium]